MQVKLRGRSKGGGVGGGGGNEEEGWRGEESAYSKNPRFKIQKLLRSRIVELNQKCLFMKSYETIPEDSGNQVKINRPGTLSLKVSMRANRYNQERQRQMSNKTKKNAKTQFELRTIDVIKQQISKTLVKDLLSLHSNPSPNPSPKHKNRPKLPTKPRNHTINYNECCELAEQRQQDLLRNSQKQSGESIAMTPKLCVFQNKKMVAPLIYFFKKKEIGDREECGKAEGDGKGEEKGKDCLLSLRRKGRGRGRGTGMGMESGDQEDLGGGEVYSQRKKRESQREREKERQRIIREMEARRMELYSPWQSITNKYQLNPQISQQLFGISKYNKYNKSIK